MNTEVIRHQLIEKALKVTPQRTAILDAIVKLSNHPTAEQIIAFVRKNHPNIATGTVYKVLDAFTEKGLVKRVKTEKDIMRYDAVVDNHHHLYCSESDRIADYYDEQLDELLDNYFKNKGIHGFKIEDVKLQIIGKFL